MAKRSGSQYPHIRLEILLIKHILYMFNMFIYVYKDINVYNIYMFMYIKHINVYKHICVYKHIYMFIYVFIYIYIPTSQFYHKRPTPLENQ